MRPDKVSPKLSPEPILSQRSVLKTTYDPNRHRRRSIRLKGWDYGSEGAYFITVCARNQLCVFGEVSQDRVRLNALDEVVRMTWMQTAVIHPDVVLDEFVVMPNHFHGIVFLSRTACHVERATPWVAPTSGALRHSLTKPIGPKGGSIGAIVGQFKSVVTKGWSAQGGFLQNPIWQRGYYDHIIRGERELDRVRQYIIDNPARWGQDKLNPKNLA
jgi:putative transposase